MGQPAHTPSGIDSERSSGILVCAWCSCTASVWGKRDTRSDGSHGHQPGYSSPARSRGARSGEEQGGGPGLAAPARAMASPSARSRSAHSSMPTCGHDRKPEDKRGRRALGARFVHLIQAGRRDPTREAARGATGGTTRIRFGCTPGTNTKSDEVGRQRLGVVRAGAVGVSCELDQTRAATVPVRHRAAHHCYRRRPARRRRWHG